MGSTRVFESGDEFGVWENATVVTELERRSTTNTTSLLVR
jgi:hypothetical protein